MKKIILFFLLLSIFAALSSAEIVKNGNTIDSPAGELSVNLYYREDAYIASVRSDKFRAVLDVGECENYDLYKICLKNAEEVDDYDLGEKVIQGEISVEELVPTIERTISATEIKEGSDATVTVKLTNPGDDLPVKYTDSWPKEFIVIAPTENVKFYVMGNKVIFDRKLMGEEIIIYKVRLIAPVEKEVKATLEYNGKKITSDALKIKSKNALGIDIDLEPKNPKLFEKANLTVKLENDGEGDSINLNYAEIVFPPGIDIISADGKLTKKGAKYEYGPEELKKEISFSFMVRASKLGLHKIKVNAEAVDSGKTIKSSGEEEIDLEVKELFINLKLSSILFKSNGIQIKATIENKNEMVTFKNLNCAMQGLYSKEYKFVQVLPEKALDIEDDRFNIEDTSTRTATQSLKCDYETNTGEKMSTVKSKEVLINISSDDDASSEDDRTGGENEENNGDSEDDDNGDSGESGGANDGDRENNGKDSNVIIEDDKPGFFSRIINFFKNIFSTKPAFEKDTNKKTN